LAAFESRTDAEIAGDPDRGATTELTQELSFPNVPKPAVDPIGEISQFPNLPIGGTTGLCHQSSAAIEIAAAWYRMHSADCGRPIIPALRARFGLTPLQAIAVLREAARA
jgi:hypothetical protein